MDTYNIYNLLSTREVNGGFISKKVRKTNLIRNEVDKYEYESTSHWPVETWRYNKLFICVLYNFDDHEEFLEDLFFNGHYFDAVLADYLNCHPISYV